MYYRLTKNQHLLLDEIGKREEKNFKREERKVKIK
jgi:hypothetical protein